MGDLGRVVKLATQSYSFSFPSVKLGDVFHYMLGMVILFGVRGLSSCLGAHLWLEGICQRAGCLFFFPLIASYSV